MLGRDEQMHPGYVDFQIFAQGFGFSRGRLFFMPGIPKKTHQVGFRQDCDKGVA